MTLIIGNAGLCRWCNTPIRQVLGPAGKFIWVDDVAADDPYGEGARRLSWSPEPPRVVFVHDMQSHKADSAG